MDSRLHRKIVVTESRLARNKCCGAEAEPEKKSFGVDIMSVGVEGRSRAAGCVSRWSLERGCRFAAPWTFQNLPSDRAHNRRARATWQQVMIKADGKLCNMRLPVAKVPEPLLSLSVGRVCDETNRVIFDRTGDCVQHIAIGEVHFRRKTPTGWR